MQAENDPESLVGKAVKAIAKAMTGEATPNASKPKRPRLRLSELHARKHGGGRRFARELHGWMGVQLW